MNVHLEVLSSNFQGVSDLCVIWQGQHETKINNPAQLPSEKPSVVFCPQDDERSVLLNLYVMSKTSKLRSVQLEHHLQILEDVDTTIELHFEADEVNKVEGYLRFKYRCESITNYDKIRDLTREDFSLNISFDFLNTLFEPPMRGKVQVYNADSILMAKCVVNNLNRSLLLPVKGSIGERGLTVFFTELVDDTQILAQESFQMVITPLQSIVYSLPTLSGKVIVAEVHLIRKRESLSAMYHSAVFREGQVIADTNSSSQRKARISLTPRRTLTAGGTGGGEGHSPMGGHRSGRQSVIGAVKYVLYLHDASVANLPHDSFTDILQNVRHATRLPTSSIATTEKHIVIPSNHQQTLHGGYIVCSSKSEIVENMDAIAHLVSAAQPKKGKSKRKALQNICLGLLKLGQAHWTSPIKLQGTILKIDFETSASEANTDTMPENALPVSPLQLEYRHRCEIFYSGALTESSREIFNDTGLISCTLEGTLFRPATTSTSASASDLSPPTSARDAGEKCMAFKVYLSIIAGAQEESALESESSLVVDATDTSAVAQHLLEKEIETRQNQQQALAARLQEGAEYNRVEAQSKEGKDDGAEEGELPGVSTVNHPLRQDNEPSQRDLLLAIAGGGSNARLLMDAAELEQFKSMNKSSHSNSAERLQNDSSLVPVLSVARLHTVPPEMTAEEDDEDTVQAATLPLVNSKKSLLKSAANSHTNSQNNSQNNSQTQSLATLPQHAAPSSVQSPQPPLPQQQVKPAAKASTAFVEIIRDELAEKQRLIDRLLQELDEKYAAIQVCGRDIVQLREEKAQLRAQVKDLQADIQCDFEAEERAQSIASDLANVSLEGGESSNNSHQLAANDMNKTTLLKVISKLHAQLQTQARDQRLQQQQLTQLQQQHLDTQSLYTQLQAKHEELQATHTQSQRYIQSIGRDIAKVDLFRQTIRTQEQMIARLQNVMESKVRAKFSALRAQASRFSFDEHENTEDAVDQNNGDDNGDTDDDKRSNRHKKHRHHHKHRHLKHAEDHNNAQQDELKEAQQQAQEEHEQQQKQIAQQRVRIEELDNLVRHLEDELDTLRVQAQEAARVQAQKDAEEEAEKAELELDEEGDAPIDMQGRRPAALKNVKKANLKIDQLVAEVCRLYCYVFASIPVIRCILCMNSEPRACLCTD